MCNKTGTVPLASAAGLTNGGALTPSRPENKTAAVTPPGFGGSFRESAVCVSWADRQARMALSNASRMVS
jgi:hypothetical protein